MPTSPRAARPGLRQDERLAAIAEVVLAGGTVRITDLAQMFDVSAMTIHRDLDTLDAKGILRKSRGQVTAIASNRFDASTEYRLRQNVAEKQALCRVAATLVEPGQTVIMDDSSTGVHLAHLLAERPPLTVITNFQRVIEVLGGRPGIALVVTGGLYYQWGESYIGSVTTTALSGMRADVVFMSTPAVTDGRCFHPHHDVVAVKRAMFDAAKRRVLLLDHSKLSNRALHQHHAVAEFDMVIVDDGIEPDDLARLEDTGVEVLIAPVLHRH